MKSAESKVHCEVLKKFSDHHLINLSVEGQNFPLLVDDCFLMNNQTSDCYLKVFVVSSVSEHALIEVPSSSLGDHSRMWVPKNLLK